MIPELFTYINIKYIYIYVRKKTYMLTFDNRYFLSSLHFKNNNYLIKNYIQIYNICYNSNIINEIYFNLDIMDVFYTYS